MNLTTVSSVAADPSLATAPPPPTVKSGRIEGRPYYSDNFPPSQIPCWDDICSDRVMAVSWERERDACLQGDCATGCKIGFLTRIKYLGDGLVSLPLGVISIIGLAITTLGACGCAAWQRGRAACSSNIANSSRRRDGAIVLTRLGWEFGTQTRFVTVSLARNIVMIPLNIIFPEGLSAAGQHKWALSREQARGEKRKKTEEEFRQLKQMMIDKYQSREDKAK